MPGRALESATQLPSMSHSLPFVGQTSATGEASAAPADASRGARRPQRMGAIPGTAGTVVSPSANSNGEGETRQSDVTTWTSGLLVSAVLHAALMLLMAAWLLHERERDLVPGIDSVLLPGQLTPDPLEEVDVDGGAPPVENQPQPAKAQMILDLTAADAQIEPDIDLHEGAFEGGIGGGGQGGRGEAIFGTGREANSFVFVVDCSGSMKGQRFYRATLELKRVIGNLKLGQKFYVVFYNHEVIPLFAPGRAAARPVLIPASRSNRRTAHQWIDEQQAGGGTLPQKAMELALSLQPEVVYFLTDGRIPPETSQVIEAANKHNAVVNTVALESGASSDILKRIARANGGKYRYVK